MLNDCISIGRWNEKINRKYVNNIVCVRTVLTGARGIVIGVVYMAAVPSVAITAAGYAAYNVGAMGMILGSL